jgi:hypothetical protein
LKPLTIFFDEKKLLNAFYTSTNSANIEIAISKKWPAILQARSSKFPTAKNYPYQSF